MLRTKLLPLLAATMLLLGACAAEEPVQSTTKTIESCYDTGTSLWCVATPSGASLAARDVNHDGVQDQFVCADITGGDESDSDSSTDGATTGNDDDGESDGSDNDESDGNSDSDDDEDGESDADSDPNSDSDSDSDEVCGGGDVSDESDSDSDSNSDEDHDEDGLPDVIDCDCIDGGGTDTSDPGTSGDPVN